MGKLATALKMQKKMEQVGFDWPNIEGVLAKIDEEKGELVEAIQGENREHIEEELGDLLFAVVNLPVFRFRSRFYHRVTRRFADASIVW